MNLNPIDFNYIDGENIYPLQEYIDEQINSLSFSSIYSSNVFLNNNLKINDALFFSTSSNLYIKNKIAFGEIRFSTFINYPDNSNYDYGTKIDFSGRMQVYHNYNLLQPTFPAGWYDVSDELLQLKADGISTDFQLTALDATLALAVNDIIAIDGQLVQVSGVLVYLQEQLNLIQQEIDYIAGDLAQRTEIMTASTTANELIESFGQYLLRDRNRLNTTISGGVQLAIGASIIGGIASLAGYLYNERMSNLAYNIQPSNFTLTGSDRSNILYQTDTQTVYFSSNYNIYNCNQCINNGFISSNVIIQQLIPSLNTYTFTLNGVNINTTFATKQDTLTAATNLLGIGTNISALDYNKITINKPTNFQCDYNTTLINKPTYFPVDPDITTLNKYLLKTGGALTGSIFINQNTYDIPQKGNFGGPGDRILFKSGTSTTFPASLGMSTNSLWTSVNDLNTIDFYSNGIKNISLGNDTLTLDKSIISTNNKLSFTQAVGNIGLDVLGGTGDRIILYPGVLATTYPYSIGCSTNNLYFSAGSGGYIFYSGGGIKFRINNVGNIYTPGVMALGTATINTAYGLQIADTAATTHLRIDGALTKTALSIGGNGNILIDNPGNVGQRFSIRETTGNVGIGTSIGTNKLDVRGLMNVEGIAIVDGASYTNQYQIFITAPTTDLIPGSASIQTIHQNFGFGQNLNIQTATGSTLRLGATTCSSTLNITGATTCSSSLTVSGNVGIGTNSTTQKLDVRGSCHAQSLSIVENANYGGNQYQLMFNPPSALTNASIQTVQQNVGNSQILNIQTLTGSVLIVGSTICSSSLNINGVATCSSTLNITGATTCASSLTINNSATSKLIFSNDLSDYKIQLWTGYGFGINPSTLRYNSGGYHAFYTNGTSTAVIDSSGNLTLVGNLYNTPNVMKRASFQFTPVQTGAFPYIWAYTINLASYINAYNGFSTTYIFRITICTNSFDYGADGNTVGTMQYVIFISNYAGGKGRVHQIFNSTSGTTIGFINSTSVAYVAPPGQAGNSSSMYCMIENLAYY